MSLFEDVEKDRPNQFRVPPIRKLFSSQTIEESDQDSRQDLETFKVFLRLKPILDNHAQNTIKIVDSRKLICKPPSSSKLHKAESVEYIFSRIFPGSSTQHDIFNDCVVPCLNDLINLQNSLIFTYGTTNAGKTYTVQGHPTDPGIIPRTLYSLFTNIRENTKVVYMPLMSKNCRKLSPEEGQEKFDFTKELLRSYVCRSKFYKNMSYSEVLNYEYRDLTSILEQNFVELNTNYKMPACTIWVSFIEVYNEIILDLLEFSGTRKPLKLSVDKYNNFYVKGLNYIIVRTFEEAYSIYRIGKKNLNFASTKMNENSSRSHCIFTIKLINEYQEVSNLSICDLAGTERQTKAQNFGMRLKESSTINSSLFQLNRCLRTLRENQTKNTTQIIPYRLSKLTQLFQNVFNDKSDEKIVMIVNINPLAELYDETQQVLKMCAIASKIKNKPVMPKLLRQSIRFTSYVYGKDSSSLLDEQSENDYFDCEEDSAEVQCDEIQHLREQLALKERELKTMKEQYDGCRKLYEEKRNALDEFIHTVDNDQKELEESYKRRIEFYEQKLRTMKNNPENLCSDNDLRNEILEKDLLIEELKVQLASQTDGRRPSLNTVKEIYEKDKKIEELESLLTEGKTAYKTLVDEVNSMSEKLNSVENQLQEKTEYSEQLEVNLSQKQSIIEDLEARIESLEEKMSENALEFENVLSNLETQRNEIKDELEVVKVAAEEEKKTFEEKIKELTVEINKMSENALEFENVLSDLETQRNVIKDEFEVVKVAAEEEKKTLEEKIKELTVEINTLKNVVEKQVEGEKQLNAVKSQLETVLQENELLQKEFKILKDREIELEVKGTKRYNTRNNRTPLKQVGVGKENKQNSSAKLRKAKSKDKQAKADIANDSVEYEFFRAFDPVNGSTVERTPARKKKLFSTPVSTENLISFDSQEKNPGKFLDCNFEDKSSEVATPAQIVKALRKKRLN